MTSFTADNWPQESPIGISRPLMWMWISLIFLCGAFVGIVGLYIVLACRQSSCCQRDKRKKEFQTRKKKGENKQPQRNSGWESSDEDEGY